MAARGCGSAMVNSEQYGGAILVLKLLSFRIFVAQKRMTCQIH